MDFLNSSHKKNHEFASHGTPIASVNKYPFPTKDFVVIDLETTGRGRDAKITQISAIKITNDEITDSFDYLINPECEIPKEIVFLTGITNEIVQDKPTIKEIMPIFMSFVTGNVIVGHNIARFDIHVLLNNNFNLPKIDIIDTLDLCKNCDFDEEIEDHKLPTLKKYYGINAQSHNAFEDCKTNMIIYQKLRDNDMTKVDIPQAKCPQILKGLRFVVTGQFIGISRDDIEDEIKRYGGKVTHSVSGKTDYLIDGTQVDHRLKSEKSNKERKAEELQQQGSGIKIIDYDTFKQMI